MSNQRMQSILGNLLLIFLLLPNIRTECNIEKSSGNDVIKCNDVTIENLSKEIENVYKNNSNITELLLSNINFRTLNNLNSSFIQEIKTLKVINNSADINQNSFNNFKSCETIELSENNIGYFEGFKNARLKRLIANNSNIMTANNICQYSPNLTHISLPRNKIDSIIRSFTNCKELTFLDLSDNNIKEIKSEVFRGLDNLVWLYLNQNKIMNIPSRTFKYVSYEDKEWHGLKKLTELRLDHNSLGTIEGSTFAGLSGLRELNLSNAGIVNISLKSFEGLTLLNNLYMSSNPITDLPLNYFKNLNITSLDLSKSNLTILHKDQFASVPFIRDIIISNSKINIIEKGALNSMKLLEKFDVSYNFISEISCDISGNLHNMKYLNMSNNMITRIDYCAFQKFASLQELYLNNNLIKHLSASTFSDLRTLKLLNIADNKLKYLDDYFVNSLNQFTKLKSVILTGNPWDCQYLNTTVMQFIERNISTQIDENNTSENISNLMCKLYIEMELKENFTVDTFNKTCYERKTLTEIEDNDSSANTDKVIRKHYNEPEIKDDEKPSNKISNEVKSMEINDTNIEKLIYDNWHIILIIVSFSVVVILQFISLCWYRRKYLSILNSREINTQELNESLITNNTPANNTQHLHNNSTIEETMEENEIYNAI